ncbi:MAG: discoidin domain-containing protein [Planctomycetes bacterium]|nr:discoidin domain-containing protein [Planctomycetota bacterium]
MRTRILCWTVIVAVHGWNASAVAETPVITPEQIEADWLRQDELRNSPVRPTAGKPNVTREQDAAGGVDGRINGTWGFHTENETDPWWQVDLGAATAIDRMVLYNRCDGNFAARAARFILLFSDDGKSWRQVYQHDGTVFQGHADKKPAVVTLDGKTTRLVRIQLPGTVYFHLDEVQVFSPGGEKNVALGCPATQSSTSTWSAMAGKPIEVAVASAPAGGYPIALAIERGLKLAENLTRAGADVAQHEQTLRQVAERFGNPSADASDDDRRALYMQARWAVRRMAMANPLLDFDEVLFVKRAPTLFPHVSDQCYGWWSRAGGGVYILSGFKGDQPKLRCLTGQFEPGNFFRPDLSYDGRRVLFAYCKTYPHVSAVGDKTKKEELPEDAFYHLFEMNVDGSGLRQLTRGYYDDFDARYLPDGDIVFLSTRKGTALQAGKQSAASTCVATQPDSFVRCGGGNHRPVAVFTLHRINGDGDNLRAISAFENFEWTPSVADDGRILYARWDYIDRFNGHFMSLWSTNPDGTGSQLVYGNYTKKPQCIFEARSIPGSHKLVFTATAHHSITGGSMVLLDRTRGLEGEAPLERLTPEVCFPETEGWPNSYYGGPWPLSEEHFLCSWSDRKLPGHRLMAPDDPNNPRNASGVYLYDAFGNLNLLHRDPDISCTNPIAVQPRTKPARRPELVDWEGPQEGNFLLQNVYEGLTGVAQGDVARLRVVAVPPKVQPQMNSPSLGVSREDPGKFVLGTVPVESDGSAFFRVPSGVPLFFQALDHQGRAVQTMRSLTYVQPNETLACVGCHEGRRSTPRLGRIPLAAAREASKLRLGPEGTWPLRYDALVQPVLDRHCVSCHRADGDDAKAAKFVLTGPQSYNALLEYADGDLRKLVFERDASTAGQGPALQSKLLALLTAAGGHEKVKLDPDSLRRLIVWMDTYAHRLGSYSPEQEEQLREFRQRCAGMLER